MLADRAQIEMVLNGQAGGPMGDGLNRTNVGQGTDLGILRPWVDGFGNRFVSVRNGKQKQDAAGAYVFNKKGEPVPAVDNVPLETMIQKGLVPNTFNATALPKDVWEMIDRSVLKASRQRQQAWADLRAANTLGGFDGMAVTSLIRDTVTDPGIATIDMDGLSEPKGDRPLYVPDSLPLPITHSGFYLGERFLASSRRGGQPMDTSLTEASANIVSEEIEKVCIGEVDVSAILSGSATDYTNRGIYGYMTQPNRMTKTMTTASATATPLELLTDILDMINTAHDSNFNGPFVLYFGSDWDTLLESDYVVGAVAQGYTSVLGTVRERIERINKISSVRSLDFISTDNTVLLVQMTSDTVRAVSGMEITTVQWDTRGGQQHNFQVMGIQVPDLRSVFVGHSTDADARVCGIVHGSK